MRLKHLLNLSGAGLFLGLVSGLFQQPEAFRRLTHHLRSEFGVIAVIRATLMALTGLMVAGIIAPVLPMEPMAVLLHGIMALDMLMGPMVARLPGIMVLESRMALMAALLPGVMAPVTRMALMVVRRHGVMVPGSQLERTAVQCPGTDKDG